MFLFSLLLLAGAIVAPAFTINAYTLTNIVKCLKCNRVIGSVLANGDFEICNTRVVKYQTVRTDMELECGQELSLRSVSEQRSLHGKYQGHKRHMFELDIDEPLVKKPRFSTELQCFRAAIQHDNCIASMPFEDLPTFPEEEDDESDLFAPLSDQTEQRDLFFNEDVFFDQDTIAFPLNMPSIYEPSAILPDYESVSFDGEFFARPYSTPFDVYHPNDGDNSEWPSLLSVDQQFSFENEVLSSEIGQPDDNISDFFDLHSLSDGSYSSMATSFNEFLLDHFADIANNITICEPFTDDGQ